ncbi:hypothetical protein EKO27_g7140 [Xylaria grammica]|uniref:Uncharacterized protein n=1 Tax=Xylaria grammica TaxID=363999 RepID=A0A439D0I9_9PEZI|nr:hypothetical protein EKO27_g7140 [Xylaria grammica]
MASQCSLSERTDFTTSKPQLIGVPPFPPAIWDTILKDLRSGCIKLDAEGVLYHAKIPCSKGSDLTGSVGSDNIDDIDAGQHMAQPATATNLSDHKGEPVGDRPHFDQGTVISAGGYYHPNAFNSAAGLSQRDADFLAAAISSNYKGKVPSYCLRAFQGAAVGDGGYYDLDDFNVYLDAGQPIIGFVTAANFGDYKGKSLDYFPRVDQDAAAPGVFGPTVGSGNPNDQGLLAYANFVTAY